MKTIYTVLLALIITATAVLAQAPNKMSYQTVIRNSSNALVTNKPVGIKISVLQGSSTGTVAFAETHNATTNANGLASIEIGGGTATTGTFAAIDWSKGPYFIKTETDPNGGTNYSISGTSQLLSVPYAMASNTAVSAGTANGLSATATGVVRTINGQGGNVIIAGGGGTTISRNGDTVKISSTSGSGGTGIQGVQNTDGTLQITNPNGPVATLGINNNSITAAKLAAGVIPTTLPPSGAASGDLSGTYPNPTVGKIQGRDVAATAPTTGQVLSWNGTQWAPAAGGSGWSLTGNSGTTPATNFIGTIDNQPLVLRTNNVEQMRILGTGNVGIGTTAPTRRLSVVGNSSTGVMNIQNTSSSGYSVVDFIDQTGTSRLGIGYSNSSTAWNPSTAYINAAGASGELHFMTADTRRMMIGSNGNVGIGTASPGKTLDVNGAIRTNNHFIFNSTNGVINWGTQDLYFRTNSTVGDEAIYNDKMIIKNNGNVGIGTTTPSSTLHIQTSGNGLIVNNPATTGTSGVKVAINSSSGTATNYTSYVYTGVAAWSTGINNSSLDYVLSQGETSLNTPRMVCKFSTGNVGIGTTAPTSLLSVNGTADKPGGGSWATFSDARLKQDVRAYSPGLSDVLKIRPVTYHYNETSGLDTKTEYIGVIAQELQQVAPNMVTTFTKDGTEYLKVDNSGMTYMLVNAVKELSKQNTELQAKLDKLNPQHYNSMTERTTQQIQQLQSENQQLKEMLRSLQEEVHILSVKVAVTP